MVEDDATTRRSIVEVLEAASYSVTGASDGEQAIDILQQATRAGAPFDVVVTDIRMGTVDGIEVLHVARHGEVPPEVIILTGYGTMDTSIAALRASAYDYLIKPCEPTQLLNYVAGAVQRHQNHQRQAGAIRSITQAVEQLHGHNPDASPAPPPPERYTQLGALTIDSFQHTATFAGKPLHLTPIEYSLLYCLAEAQGRVLSYSEIAHSTHGVELDKTDAHTLLKPHILHLRRKISPECLVNVRGIGYILVPPTAPDPAD